MKMKAKKGDFVTLIKISDDKFHGNHPNGIYEGYSTRGVLQNDVTVGNRVIVSYLSEYLNTSPVKEIINEDTFKTLNSTYRLTLVEFEDINYGEMKK